MIGCNINKIDSSEKNKLFLILHFLEKTALLIKPLYSMLSGVMSLDDEPIYILCSELNKIGGHLIEKLSLFGNELELHPTKYRIINNK